MRMRAGGAALVVAAMIALTACSGTQQVTVDAGHLSGTVPVGGELVVDLGEVSSGVGDGWLLVEAPDPKVLGEPSEKFESEAAKPAPGSSSVMTVTFPAVGKGETTLTYEYRFRGEVPEDPADQQTLTFDITVR
ncbi:protease inhibitor I42 family protein [Microbacterium sp. NPDC057659]|uniref:protease inhibitor I42 family protein n=1 Tax=Microbacterium sp. NPDC057659 TaxID=3346198 RepID=UPI00366E27BB